MSIGPSRFAVLLAVLPALVLAGCERGEDARDSRPGAAVPASTGVDAPRAPATVDAAAPADAAAGVDATRVVDRAPVAGAGDGFDVRAFAGAFGSDGTRLEFAADGTYVLAESAGAGPATTGTWTVEDDGARIRLDPDSKDARDRVFAVASRDQLVPGDGGRVLRRVGD